MEDEHLLCPCLSSSTSGVRAGLPSHLHISLYAVFDGHGGRRAAIFVRENLAYEVALQLVAVTGSTNNDTHTHTLAHTHTHKDMDTDEQQDEPMNAQLSLEDIKKAIHASFQRLDSRLAVEMATCKDGCTAVVVCIHGTLVVVAGLGDSSAVLARRGPIVSHSTSDIYDNDMHAIPLTMPHKPWVPTENARILKRGGTVENGRVNGALEVTRSFGDMSLKRYGVLCTPTLMKFDVNVAQDEFLLIGCDGLWNPWTGLEAIQATMKFIAEESFRSRTCVSQPLFDISSVCRRLVDTTIEDKRSQDNVSALLVMIVPHNIHI
eukprot:GHVR01058877.1.p1 GENE.GHVR01058877.1~~GHVR01058877.1.p1  ORF type:complete len:320 (-),score=74.21 GHVR01058877.1:78-1037(-)